MITTDCVWCGHLGDCDRNYLCDYCQTDSEALEAVGALDGALGEQGEREYDHSP